MLRNEEIKKIEDFVYTKPRAIQEIAEHLDVSWRTADRYIQEIQTNFGTITTRVFREGTRGALKIVYWASVDKISNNIFQEELEQEILRGRTKEDFSGFDIYQHASEKNKKAQIKHGENEEKAGNLEEFETMLNQAKKQILFFSGNLSFINLKNKNVDVFKILENLVKRGISMKILCRIDLAGKENIEKLLSLNFKYGKELIEIHHKEHPLRATVIDNTLLNLKEILEPTGREKELNKKVFIFYTIKDKEWIEWISKVFWKIFSQTINASKRLNEMKGIKI